MSSVALLPDRVTCWPTGYSLESNYETLPASGMMRTIHEDNALRADNHFARRHTALLASRNAPDHGVSDHRI